MIRKKIILIVLCILLSSLSPTSAMSGELYSCSNWRCYENSKVTTSLDKDVYVVKLKQKNFSWASTIPLDRKLRYNLNWDFEAKAELVRNSGIGLAFGNDTSGIIFELTEKNQAQLKSYRNSSTCCKRKKRIKNKSSKVTLNIKYSIKTGILKCFVNSKPVFELNLEKTQDVPSPSKISRISLITTSHSGCNSGVAKYYYVKANGTK